MPISLISSSYAQSASGAAAAASAAASAPPFPPPLWTLEGLRAADPVLGLAVLMLAAILLAEALHRAWRVPRICGHMLVGAIAGPMLLRLIDRDELDNWKPLIDLAIGAMLFELGTRIRPRWLVDNPWLAASCVLQAAVCGGLVALVLALLGAPPLSAAVVGMVACSTSAVIVLSTTHEARSRGQVTERLLLMTAINSVVAVVGLKVLRVALATGLPEPGDELSRALFSALLVIGGSVVLGIAIGQALHWFSPLVRATPAMVVLQIALVILASMLAAQWRLSPLLTLLVAGMAARSRMAHALTVEPFLGSAGAALSILLFVSIGVLFTLGQFWSLWPWVAAIIVARLAGTALVVGAFAHFSGLGWRQAAALTIGLQSMSSLAVLLAADTFGWTAQLPGADAPTVQALVIATTLMQLTGPVWTHFALRHVARESNA